MLTKTDQDRTIPLTPEIGIILESRRSEKGGPFRFTGDQVYDLVVNIFKGANIENASPHTLRKTAGAWYYMATRDIFAASKFLGHTSVKVTEEHYSGLIQRLQVKYAQQFSQLLSIWLPN